jgi:hypothetical protein
MLQKSRWVYAKCFIAISGLEKRRACGFFMTGWFQEIPSSLHATSSLSQPKRKSLKFEAASDGTDRTQAGRLLMGYH